MTFDQRAQDWDNNPMRHERAKAVAQAIRKYLPQQQPRSALEYGCGTGLLSFALQHNFQRITLADSSSGMIEELQRKINQAQIGHFRPLQLDLLRDPLPQERFNVIYTLMTLHHIQDIPALLRAFHDLLLPEGILFVADLDKEDGTFHEYEFHGHHGFERPFLAQLAEQAGFNEIIFETVYTIKRLQGNETRDFPLFIMKALRSR